MNMKRLINRSHDKHTVPLSLVLLAFSKMAKVVFILRLFPTWPEGLYSYLRTSGKQFFLYLGALFYSSGTQARNLTFFSHFIQYVSVF